MDAQADAIFNAVRSAIKARRVTVASAAVIITAAMTAAEKLGGLTGPEKKALVLDAAGRVVDELPMGAEDKSALKAAVALLGPSVVDAIVAAQKGQLGLGRSGCWRAFKCCK